jgi:hypothetical protein
LKGNFFKVTTIDITTTSTAEIISHSCTWIGHCLNDPCVTYDDWYVLKTTVRLRTNLDVLCVYMLY